MCKNIPKDEWSGPLFYTFEGTIEKPEEFKIIIQDILPLDKGTQAFTSYSIDNRFIDYMEEDFETRSDWCMGHCHSHNTMGVFFSGTDVQELKDNAPNYNFYVSLIVNNYMEMVARVAFMGKMEKSLEQVPYYSTNEFGVSYVIETKDFTVAREKMFYYECEIVCERELITVASPFAQRVAEIMKPKPAPAKTVYTPVAKVTDNKKAATVIHDRRTYQGKDKEKNTFKTYAKTFVDDFKFEDLEDISDAEDDRVDRLDFFLTALFKFVGEPLHDETFDSVLAEWDNVENIDPLDIAIKISGNYGEIYAAHFPDADDQDFTRDGYEVLDMLYDEETEYPFLKPTIATLLQMIKNFETIQK